ncbi:MAG TPA: 2-isopropylmalate synthase [Candidatus Diapherotrites archaeon]|uniref:2-isopropylmalate synthase n=1 Tax=Candidatus Iainarchaeum sp. TaxID=3101447 RepID=A0A7J4IWD4_9ARCH|nr:2-isopropylmalate synthase [Candidatus Diapherotrites archaeon]
MAKRVIRIFDTTLRDGEQTPGAALTSEEKVIIARQLEKLNVDIIEAGFPAAGNDDFNAVKEISSIIGKPAVCALGRCRKEDIDIAAKALEGAKRSRIHVFIATSPIHMKFKLKMEPGQVIKEAEKCVGYAAGLCDEVEFSPEDAGRSEPEFLYTVLEKAIHAGATTLNIPDTVGYTQPSEYGALIKGVIENTPGYNDSVTVSTHCHNDLGQSVANSLAGVMAGAGQVECTVNGIGERAGNAALEEIVMNIHTRERFFNAATNINLREIYSTSKMVSELTSIPVQPNKAVVGRNAFAHASGVHQHGILSNREVYEIMNPKMIGKETELVIGKLSGRAAIADFLKKNGIEPDENELAAITSGIKEAAAGKKGLKDDEIVAIAAKAMGGRKDLPLNNL